MCRITGFWDFNENKNYDFSKTLENMRDVLTHGGPDDAGSYIEKETGLALGHRRLSILDLSAAGHNPMWDETKQYGIIFNGEVYNFAGIKKELLAKGHKFNSDTDTEVILKAYIEWGLDSVQKFRGMFAYAIWDRKKEQLILCRDRVGVKPLYWYFKNKLFMFASELKSFHQHPKFEKELNKEALSLFLQYGYIIAPHSIFKDAYKLEPGHFLIINKNQEIKKIKYWDVENSYQKGLKERKTWLKKSENEIAEELEALLLESFKLRMVSDVPVGMFLSGGVDSSLLTALLQKEYSKPLKTFTIGFKEPEYNEANWARKVSDHLGTDHTELYCSAQDAFEVIPKLPEMYDEPFGDSSAIPTYLVSKLAKTKVKVALSADGGDEQFCGYTGYNLLAKIQKIKSIPLAKEFIINKGTYNLIKLVSNFKTKWQNYDDKYAKLKKVLSAKGTLNTADVINKYFFPEELKSLGLTEYATNTSVLSNDCAQTNDISLAMLMDLKAYLPDDVLVKVDRAGMQVALEGRDPFLDHKIIEYTTQMPYALKIKNNENKYFLKKILGQYLPREYFDRPKKGFGIPMYEWFQQDLKGLYQEYLNENRIKNQGIFKADEIKKLLDKFSNNQGVQANKLWYLFIFAQWHEKWM